MNKDVCQHKMWVLLGAIVLFCASVNSQCFYPDDASKKLNTESRANLYKGQMEFTLNIFNVINNANDEDNIFFSPYSVYHSLLLAYISANGHTEKTLQRALRINEDMDKVNLMTAYKVDKRARMMQNNSESYQFLSANKMFAASSLKVRRCMMELLTEELETLNFRQDPVQARQDINNWVAEVTRNNILDLIPKDGITANTKLVLANAAYFKGVWSSKFLPENTKKGAFYVSETRQTIAPFMRQKGTFHYMVSEDLGAQVLELPYKGNDISMYILLPPYSMKEGVKNIIQNLTPERLAAVVEENYMAREVIVEIPKFSIEKSLPLRSILEELQVGDLFNATADFTTLTEDSVLFDDAVHKAKFRIDEEGTVAAAATAIFGFRSSRPTEPTLFTANFPFVYLIYERPTNSVLFMGVFRDPKK